jgi:hypothetical protein
MVSVQTTQPSKSELLLRAQAQSEVAAGKKDSKEKKVDAPDPKELDVDNLPCTD